MGFISKQVLKVIDWKDGAEDVMAYKYPIGDSTEIMNGCQLLVRPSQTAALVSNGNVAEIYPPGRWKLETKSLPLLADIMSWGSDFDGPFRCDVYYINSSVFSNQNWGTPGPVTMRDQDYGIVRFRAHGTFSYKLGNAEAFLAALFGAGGMASADFVSERLKKIITGLLGQALAESGVKLTELSVHFAEVAAKVRELAEQQFAESGMELADFELQDIALDEESRRAVAAKPKGSPFLGEDIRRTAEVTLAAAANREYVADLETDAEMYAEPEIPFEPAAPKKAEEVAVRDYSYRRTEPPVQPVTVTPVQPVTQPVTPVQPATYSQPVASAPEKCPMCGTVNRAGVKFCRNCGAKMKAVCTKCGCELEPGTKFCGECGEPLAAKPATCAKCNTKLKDGAKFCAVCGTKV